MRPFRALSLVPVTAALLVVAGCSSSHRSAVNATTTSTTANATTLTTVGSTSSSKPITPTTTMVSAGGPLPKGFTVTDLTWASTTEGWALGTAPCSHAPCTSVAHTLDGGHSWAGLPAPVAYLDIQPPVSGCSSTAPCVRGVRFANAATGYAFGTTSMWLTTNGGHTWTKKAADATDALEINHGQVFRVVHPVGCSPPGCPYGVEGAPVGSTTWHSLGAPTLEGVSATLATEGTNVYVAAFGHTAGGAQDAHTRFDRSTDGGAHWSGLADPCGVTASGNEADATAISAASGGYLAVGCTGRQAGEAGFVVISADGGATFGPHRGNLLSAVPATGESVGAIAAATGQRLAVLVSDNNLNESIAISNDAGVDWTVTHTEASPTNASGASFLGFEDNQTGRAVITPGTVLTTTDGGGHWNGFTFPS